MLVERALWLVNDLQSANHCAVIDWSAVSWKFADGSLLNLLQAHVWEAVEMTDLTDVTDFGLHSGFWWLKSPDNIIKFFINGNCLAICYELF